MVVPADEPDFLIIGGGTAGLCIAARLSEDNNTKVVVLEAGEDHLADPRISTPALWPSLLGSDVDWNFVTEPQEGLKGKRIHIPHGRVLGGSSAINGEAFVATSKIGVDAWGKLGNPGWNWESLAPYYRKSHTLTLPSKAVREHLGLNYIDEKFRGLDGPIQASFPEDLNDPLPNAWITTLKNLGYPMSGDPFSGSAYGGYTNAASIDPKTRQRSYSAQAYWEPIQNRSNLKVVTGALVEKILLDASSPQVVAQGAQYFKDGKTNTINARKEVLLCAGAFHTPKLLELSGIEDASLLKTHGIPLVIDNPNVGENLQDQIMTGFSFEVKDGLKTKDNLSRKDSAAITAAMESFTKDQSGPFTVGGVFSYAFLPVVDFITPDGKKELDQEGSGGFFTYPAQGNFGGEGSGAELVQTLLPGNFYTIAVSLMHPLSRGYSHITSSDPNAKPAVNPKYLVHPLDLEIFARHVRFIGTIMRTEPLKSLLKPGGLVNHAAPKDLQDLDAIKEYIKDTGLSSWHPTSTCAMLPREAGGVVDHNLVVHQTKNLRIIDASVMPITPRGNPQSSVYAIAEKAADLITKDYGIKV